MRLFILVISFFGCVQSFTVESKESLKPIIRVVGENLPPATIADGSGQQFEVVRAIFEAQGYQLKFSVYPYKRALALVESGDADMMVGMLKGNEQDLLYSYYPHDVDNLLAIFTETNRDKWLGNQSLINSNIIVLAGLSEPFKPYLPQINYSISEVNSRKQAINKLRYNRSHYMVDSEGSYILTQEFGLAKNLIAKTIGYIEIHAAFTNTLKGEEIKLLWDENYSEFILSIEAKRIYKKWDLEREYRVTKTYYEQTLDTVKSNQ